MNIAFLFLFAIASYLIGSIPFGFLIGRYHGVDIRKVGSCNIGATNVTRVIGKRAGQLCFVGDFLKGALPVVLLSLLHTPPWWQIVILVCTMLGHIFPIYLKFKGGKGVATAAGGALALAPCPLLIALVVWIAVFYSTRYVSLASIVAAVALPVSALALHFSPVGTPWEVVMVFVLIGALAIYRHRANIKRLMAGTENRFERRGHEEKQK